MKVITECCVPGGLLPPLPAAGLAGQTRPSHEAAESPPRLEQEGQGHGIY